jgi:hypothetical protein
MRYGHAVSRMSVVALPPEAKAIRLPEREAP